MRRREFILVPAKALGGLVLSSLLGELIPAAAQDGVRCRCGFLLRRKRRLFRRRLNVSFPVTKAALGQPKREWSFTLIVNSLVLTAEKYSLHQRAVDGIGARAWLSGQGEPTAIYRAGIGLLGADFAGVSARAAGSASRKDSGDPLLSAPASTRWKACSVIRCMAATSGWLAGK